MCDAQGLRDAQRNAVALGGDASMLSSTLTRKGLVVGTVGYMAPEQYWDDGDIDGRAVRVLVDTGASVVALTREDALRLGLRLQPADFSQTVETASGPAKAAAVHLDHVAVAGARVEGVRALVVEKGLPHSLLGMSYLGRLSGFEARPTGLTLRP
jgi:aspartyl protease family protein